MMFYLWTLIPLAHKMEVQNNGSQGRDPAYSRDAEGANLAKGDTRRISQAKGPCIRLKLWKVSIYIETPTV